MTGTFEEWRVTGDPGGGFPLYEFTFSPMRADPDPEAAARGLVALIAETGGWPDGPHLHSRTVTVTAWKAENERVSA